MIRTVLLELPLYPFEPVGHVKDMMPAFQAQLAKSGRVFYPIKPVVSFDVVSDS